MTRFPASTSVKRRKEDISGEKIPAALKVINTFKSPSNSVGSWITECAHTKKASEIGIGPKVYQYESREMSVF